MNGGARRSCGAAAGLLAARALCVSARPLPLSLRVSARASCSSVGEPRRPAGKKIYRLQQRRRPQSVQFSSKRFRVEELRRISCMSDFVLHG
ncbi:hypothetical protein PDJAM_G00163850 [Pangasius djambal]|uniref:Uncharacterized protein n=1 Tax=Pangasius djambal TaxID=1691987 RepID=A0ACC5ZJY9_9TELE|nr:hypothetical protein [Pangasius djambal]